MRLSPGTRLGAFEILGPLGAGGMGEVYRGRDTRLDREVAIKVLPERHAGDARRHERLLREARAASRINHPNVVTVHEVGEQDGLWYVVSELVEGRTVRDLLADGRLPPVRAAELGLQLAAGLGAAHEQGIVHRDLKPENLIVAADGRLKILDFGIARFLDDEREAKAGAATETAEGAVLGTSGYSSPEQARGETVDPRSDLFSLGAILFEMLTGEPAFRGASAIEILSSVLRDDPLEREAARPLPEALCRLLGRCLAKSPSERFQSARDLAFALATAAAGPGRRPRRRPLLRPTLGLLIAGAAVAAGYFLVHRPPATAILAVLPFQSLDLPATATADEPLELGLADALISRLGAVEGLVVRPISAVRRYVDAADPLAAGHELGADSVLDGTIQRADGRFRLSAQLRRVRDGAHLWSGTFEEGEAGIFVMQDELALRMAEALRPALSAVERAALTRHEANDPVAFDAFLEGRYLWGRRDDESLRKAAIAFERAVTREPTYARAHAALGDALALRQGGADLYARARQHADECLRLDPRLADCHLVLALIAPHDLDWDRTDAEYRQALALEPRSALALHRYGQILALWGQFDRGIEKLLQARELDPASPILAVDLAASYWFARRPREAEATLRPVIEREPDFALAHVYLGLALFDLGRTDAALAELRRFTELDRTPVALGAYGWALARSGDRLRAGELLGEIQAAPAEAGGRDFGLAAVHVGLGEMAEGIAALERTVAAGTHVMELATHPFWEPLHADPRFVALLRRARLPYTPGSIR